MLSGVPENKPNLKHHSTKRDLKTKLRISAVNSRYYLEKEPSNTHVLHCREFFSNGNVYSNNYQKIPFFRVPPVIRAVPKT